MKRLNSVNNVKLLMLMERKITHATTFIFDSNTKSGQESKVKKFKIVYSANGISYDALQEYTIEANKNYKELIVNFMLSPGISYNFEVEIDNVRHHGYVFKFLKVWWYKGYYNKCQSTILKTPSRMWTLKTSVKNLMASCST